MEIIEKINKIHKEMAELNQKLTDLKKVSEKFPDLKIDKARRGKAEFYVSKIVNETATEVGIYPSCSCCDDAPIFAAPYVKYDNFTVYSTPREVFIGDRCFSSTGRVIPSDTWEEDLKKHGFSSNVIEQVRKYFNEHDFDDEYDDDEYDDNDW